MPDIASVVGSIPIDKWDSALSFKTDRQINPAAMSQNKKCPVLKAEVIDEARRLLSLISKVDKDFVNVTGNDSGMFLLQLFRNAYAMYRQNEKVTPPLAIGYYKLCVNLFYRMELVCSGDERTVMTRAQAGRLRIESYLVPSTPTDAARAIRACCSSLIMSRTIYKLVRTENTCGALPVSPFARFISCIHRTPPQ